jgi:hypothetical protein
VKKLQIELIHFYWKKDLNSPAICCETEQEVIDLLKMHKGKGWRTKQTFDGIDSGYERVPIYA